MASFNLEPIAPRALAGYYRLLGASLLARVATDWSAGIYRVHAGELFPWRHLPIIPLYSPALLLIEWLLLAISGAALLLFMRVRVAIYVALLATAMGLSQRYSNQTALTLIVLGCSALKPLTPADLIANPRAATPHLDLVRYQLLIVYGFSALNKLKANFLGGEALSSLLQLPVATARPLSWCVVLGELLLPVLFLSKRYRLAWAGVVLMHLVFSVLMPGLLPFGLLMIAMATLWRSNSQPASTQS